MLIYQVVLKSMRSVEHHGTPSVFLRWGSGGMLKEGLPTLGCIGPSRAKLLSYIGVLARGRAGYVGEVAPLLAAGASPKVLPTSPTPGPIIIPLPPPAH